MKKRVTVKTPRIIVLIVALLFVAIIAKMSYVVLSEKVDGINLQEKSASITTTERTLYANRGSIFDVYGDKLAESVNSYTVIAYLKESRTTDPKNPKHVVDKEKTAKELSPLLGMTEESILKLLNKKAYQVELGPGGRGITEGLKSRIEELELPGIDFMYEGKMRYYSQSTFASYIIGYAKRDTEGVIKGELGIEGYYDDILSGSNGYRKYLKYTASNYQIPNTPEEIVEAEDGSDIYLTIDRSVQRLAEKTVADMEKKYNTDWAIFTVMDANTGAIVASATNPNFNPNDTNTIVKSGYLNPLVSYQYEPGSVMKIFSWASVIEEGKYSETETYKSGSVTLSDGKTVIRDANRKGWGTITYDVGFEHSSNTAATYLAKKIGSEKLNSYYTSLGFGEKTGIELYNEVAGKNEFFRESELANAAFGQGISVTPIQMLQALSAMTNDGTVIKPYIVDKIVDNNGNVTYEGSRKVVGKVYSTETVKKMHQLMHDTLANVYKNYIPNNVTIMGKTGTAQIASKNGGYIHDTYTYVKSFAGIFPTDEPKYIVYVAARKPEATNDAWAKTIANAIEEIASYAKITNNASDIDKTKLVDLNNYISTLTEETKISLEAKKIKPIILGNGKYIINQYPLKNKTVLANSRVFLLTNGTEFKMEDLAGWSLNEVKNYCEILGIELEYSGHGYVKTQSIAKDTVIDIKNTVLKIELDK